MTNPETMVCIGGCNDGVHITTQNNPSFIVIPVPLDPLPVSVHAISDMIETHVYRIDGIKTRDADHMFWRYEGLTTDEALTKLFEGYKP